MALFLKDTFTESSDTTLASHTGEVGATWTEHGLSPTGDITVNASVDRALSNSANPSYYYASGTPATADYSVALDFVFKTHQTGSVVGVMGRVQTGSNDLYAAYYNQAALGWQLFKIVSGTPTQLGSTVAATLVADATYRMRLRMKGTTIELYVDGVQRISVTDSAITAAGRAGITHSGNTSTSTTGYHISAIWAWDNVEEIPWYVGAGTASFTATSGTALTPGLPTGWAANDIHILLVHTSSNVDIPTPSGWNDFALGSENNTGAQRVELFWRRAVGGDGSPSVAAIASTAVRGARVYGIRGVAQNGTPYKGVVKKNTGTGSASVTTNSLTISDNLTLVLFLYAYEDDPTGTTVATQPANYTHATGTTYVATSTLGNAAALGVLVGELYESGSTNPSVTVSGGTFANSVHAGILISFATPSVQASATVPLSATGHKGVGLIESASTALSAAVQRGIGKSFSATAALSAVSNQAKGYLRDATASLSLVATAGKGVGLSRLASLPLSASVRRGIGLARSTTAPLAASAQRGVGLSRNATLPLAATVQRGVGKLLSATTTLVTTRLRGVGKTYAASSELSASSIRGIGKSYTASTSLAATSEKGVGLNRSAAFGLTASFLRGVGKQLSSTISLLASIATEVGSSGYSMTLSVAVGLVASSRRGVGKAFSTSISLASLYQRGVSLTRSATQPLSASSRRGIGMVRSSTLPLAGSLRRDIGKALSTTLPLAASVRRGVALTRLSTLPLSVAVVRGIAKQLTALLPLSASLLRGVGLVRSAGISFIATVTQLFGAAPGVDLSRVWGVFSQLVDLTAGWRKKG